MRGRNRLFLRSRFWALAGFWPWPATAWRNPFRFRRRRRRPKPARFRRRPSAFAQQRPSATIPSAPAAPTPPAASRRSSATRIMPRRLRRQAARARRPHQRLSLRREDRWSANSCRSAPTAARRRDRSILQKPGKRALRICRSVPDPIDRRRLLAGGARPQARDAGSLSARQTPLRFLLADKIDLLRDTNVIGVYSDDIFSTVVIEESRRSPASIN